MDTNIVINIVIALISGIATIVAAAIAAGWKPWNIPRDGTSATDKGTITPLSGVKFNSSRIVYYQGQEYKFRKFGSNNCRIQPMDDEQDSFVVPTKNLFHDQQQTKRITRESIVINP